MPLYTIQHTKPINKLFLALIQESGLSLSELAKRIGLDKGTLSRLLHNIEISDSTYKRIAEYFCKSLKEKNE